MRASRWRPSSRAIFSPHLTIEAAKTYYDGEGTCANTAAIDHLKILPGSSVVVATEAEAPPTTTSCSHSFTRGQARILSTMLGGIDLSPFPLDGPLPDPLPQGSGSKGHYDSIVAMARRENLTIRQLGDRVAGARGKNTIHGSPTKVVDYMQEWFEKGACDGFCVMPPYIPGAHDDFCNMVVPELQRRGLFRKDYEGATLREHLGLPRPASRHTGAGGGVRPFHSITSSARPEASVGRRADCLGGLEIEGVAKPGGLAYHDILMSPPPGRCQLPPGRSAPRHRRAAKSSAAAKNDLTSKQLPPYE
jgi:hypothetical protein